MTKDILLKKLQQMGCALTPLRPNTKVPVNNSWQKHNEPTPIEEFIAHDYNMGVVLGSPSGGLVDVDIDDVRALAIANDLLPTTGMVFGRKSKPRSHRIFRATNLGSTIRINGLKGSSLIELRSTGGQTMFPLSVHPS